MTSSKPYLIRALYEWLLDNEATPLILVNANHEQVLIPQSIATDGKVVLNLAPSAVQKLEISNGFLSFSARFNGVAEAICCPVPSVLAIYARENGEGLMFTDDMEMKSDVESKPKQHRPGLKIVK